MFVYLTVGVTQAHAGIVYSQPSNNFGFFYSQNDTSGVPTPANATTFDNFTLGASSTIRNVGWVGGFLASVVNTNSITSFTVTFYNDSSGAPGSVLTTNTISGNAGQTFVGTDFFSDNVFSYNANLPTPVTVSAGKQYWLSVVANLSAGGTFQWGWENSSTGDGTGYQSFGGGTPGAITSDSAFTLSDTTVPEPSTLTLLGLGSALMVGRRRRR
jgi:hypothetical protein